MAIYTPGSDGANAVDLGAIIRSWPVTKRDTAPSPPAFQSDVDKHIDELSDFFRGFGFPSWVWDPQTCAQLVAIHWWRHPRSSIVYDEFGQFIRIRSSGWR